MRLWTFQSIQSIRELESTGILRARWDRYPAADGWKNAYKWMAAQMDGHGVSCGRYAPIWSWHSCKVWEGCPTLGDAENLLSLLEIQAGVRTVEFDCPDDSVLLSYYSCWNTALHHFLVPKEDPPPTQDAIGKMFAIVPGLLPEYEAIQATTAELQLEWVVDIRDLPLNADAQDYDPEELV